jgi:non-canonical poly(A) RNA polymerase PAPD5/7
LVILSEAIARTSPKSTLFAVAALLRARGIAKEVVVVWKARVPSAWRRLAQTRNLTDIGAVVKFKAAGGSDIAIDISLNQQSGLDAGPIVRQLLNSAGNSTAKCLIMAIKAFLVQRGLHEVFSGGLSSYSVICMVISFLQVRASPASRHDLTAATAPSQDPAKADRPRSEPGRSTAGVSGALRKAFQVRQPRLPGLSEPGSFDRTGIAIRSPGGYFDKRRKGWYRDRQPFLLSIEDPQNPGQLAGLAACAID